MNKIRFGFGERIRDDLLQVYIRNHLSFFYIPLLSAAVFIFLRFYFLGYVDKEQIIAGSLLFLLSGAFFINQQRLYKRLIRNEDFKITSAVIFQIVANKACYVLPWLFIIFWPYKTEYFFDQSLGFLMVFLSIGFYASISSSSLLLLSYDIALQAIFCVAILLLNWSNIEAPYLLLALLSFTSYSYWIGLKLNTSTKDLADKNRLLRLKTDEANRANQAKSDFLAMMSHEIRTPLHGIKGTVESLYDTKLNKEQKKFLSVISRCSQVLLSMLNNVLDLSKIEAGKISVERVGFNLHELISDIVQANAVLAEKKNIKLERQISESVPKFVVSDPVRIHQIILNLVSNAIKFTQEGGVAIHVSYNNHMVTIDIQDTGIGIDEKNIDRLFSAFEQEESSTARTFGGTGLGLPIVKDLVELLGGSIDVRSQKGQGSTFTVNIPVLHPSEEGSGYNDSEEKAADFNLEGCRVLVAEDNDVNQMNIDQTLKKYSCFPDFAADGLAAMNKAEEYQYDLILMDMNMPNLNGIEATKKIKEGKNKKVPVIGLSAVTQEEVLHDFYLAGIVDHVIKPFDRETLLSVMERYKSSNERETKEKIDQIYEDFELEFCEKFIRGSFDEIQRIYTALQSFVTEGDIENIYKTSHEICGISGNIGMYQTYSQSKHIEDLSLNKGDISLFVTKVGYLITTIERETQLIKEYIESK